MFVSRPIGVRGGMRWMGFSSLVIGKYGMASQVQNSGLLQFIVTYCFVKIFQVVSPF